MQDGSQKHKLEAVGYNIFFYIYRFFIDFFFAGWKPEA